jgi:predicted nucleic acid-binding protein
MLDSGVYITAFLCPKSSEEAAVIKSSEGLHKILVTEFLREEVYAFLREKFPEKLTAAEEFFGESEAADVTEIDNDIAYHPILRAAVSSRADILVTADSDFLESVLSAPKIMTAQEFLRYR